MFGRLTIEALPLYSAIAMGGALIVVFGTLAVMAAITWMRAWGYLWREWFTSVDHKRIGAMYVILALIMLVRGFIDAIMMRTQQAIAVNSDGYLPPDHFDQIFSSHGTIMIFFMAMPFLTGLINLVMPQQIGARDVAFPYINAMSLWLTASGAALVMVSLVIGKFSTAGWTAYPPYSGIDYSPYVGVDYWVWAVLLSGIGSTLSGINFLVTIIRKRAPGMKLMFMPLFTWTTLCTSVLMAFAFPAVTVVGVLLELDRRTHPARGDLDRHPVADLEVQDRAPVVGVDLGVDGPRLGARLRGAVPERVPRRQTEALRVGEEQQPGPGDRP